jgi:hypothetical protein
MLLWMYFHGTGNSAQLCQNFGISGGGGLKRSARIKALQIVHRFLVLLAFSFLHRFPIVKLDIVLTVHHGTLRVQHQLDTLFSVCLLGVPSQPARSQHTSYARNYTK